MAIDPGALAGNSTYFERVETLVAAMLEDADVRLPGQRRLEQRERARREGISIPAELHAKIVSLAGEARAA